MRVMSVIVLWIEYKYIENNYIVVDHFAKA